MHKTDLLAQEQLKIYEELKSKRVTEMDNDWQQIADLMLPQDSNITIDKLNENVSEWTQQVFDTTAIQAAMTYMAGDYNWTTPPQQAWAQYGVPTQLGDVGGDALAWLGEVSDDVMETFARSNFYSMRAMAALGLGVFGTDFLLFEEDEDAPGEFNFRHNRIATYVAEENYKGVIDSTKREFKMTYRQICQKFNKPGDMIPEEMEKASEGETGKQKKFLVLHCIFPREDSKRLPGRKDASNKPIASVYISMDYKRTMRVSGYDEECQLVPRFSKWGTDSPYGFGPAYVALPDARELNYLAMYMDAAAEKLIDPRILVPSSLDGDVDMRAGGVTVWDENVPDAKPSEWASATEYKLGMEIMEQKREAIREAFFVPAFKLLNSQPLIDKKMTAYEISQRLAEQLQGFTPALARRIPEFINIAMRRAFGIRYRAGRSNPKSIYYKVPDSLMTDLGGGKKGLVMPDIVVTSRISDALRALKNRGTEETMQFILPIAENHPELNLFDAFYMDKVVTDYSGNTGMSADLLRPEKGPDSVQQIRAARQQKIMAQQAAQQAELLGKAGAGLGKSPQWLQEQAQENLQGKKKAA